MTSNLFNKVKDRKIIAYDIFDQKHQRNLSDFKFRVSVYGLLRQDNQILVQRHPLVKKFGLPGGGLDLGETIVDCLKREFKEETGLSIDVEKLIEVSENFFTYENQCVQAILVFYEVKKNSGDLKSTGDDSVDIDFVNVNQLNKDNIQKIHWPIIQKYKTV